MATAAYGQDPANPRQNPNSPATPRQNPPAATTPPYNPSAKADTATPSPFLSQAIEINEAEVELGRLASSRAMDKRVKDFGNMMIKDHSAGLKTLQKLPGGKAPTKLSADHDKLKTRLSGLSGAEFDREYIDAMVAGHRDAVTLFEKETGSSVATKTDSADAQARDAARDMLPTIKKHLTEAEDIQKSLPKPATK
jgi:putative membrane protein